jgi:hypothetical protein
VDHNIVIELNEITVLMAINSIGIIGLIGAFIHLSVSAIVKGNNANPEQFRQGS